MFTIFVLDDKGKIDSTFSPVMDGTMEGPDALMELLAMHLHRLGAAKAKEGVFLGDGAAWIWLRTPWVMERTGLSENLGMPWWTFIMSCNIFPKLWKRLFQTISPPETAKEAD